MLIIHSCLVLHASEAGFLDCDKYEENKHVVFTGNGYSAEWKQEAAKRGLPNLSLSFGNLLRSKVSYTGL